MTLLAAILLLGWALAQIVAMRLRHRWRRRLELCVRYLYRDHYLPHQEWRRIEFYRRASGGGRDTLRRWARTPGRMLWIEGAPVEPGEENLDHQLPVLLKVLHDLTAKLEWASYPSAFALMVVASIPVLLAGQALGLALGARPRVSMRAIHWAATAELLLGARAARDRRLTRAELVAIEPTVRDPNQSRLGQRRR